MKTLCYIATIPAVVHAFLRPHILAVSEKYKVTVICSEAEGYLLDDLNVQIIFLPIQRKPSPWLDLFVLVKLISVFKHERFDIVHSIMPKTGLLAMLAGYLTGVSNRVHTFTGQIWVTKKGVVRLLYKRLDCIIARLATCVLADSPSQRDFLVNEGVLPLAKATVIGDGSICGVDSTRFKYDLDVREGVRRELSIAQDAKIILFVGRLNRDKGMLDLAAAFSRISEQYEDVVLLLVGAEEDVSFESIRGICRNVQDRLHHVSFTANPERYMAAADVFCLPSYREGFGLTIIEAAACGLPAVASRIYGITDAVADGETGLLFEVGDPKSLTDALIAILTNNEFRIKLGDAAHKRTYEYFSSEKVTAEMMKLYDQLVIDEV